MDSVSTAAGCVREKELVGTHKRYADRIDRPRQDHITAMIMRGSTPARLTTPELELDRVPAYPNPDAGRGEGVDSLAS